MRRDDRVWGLMRLVFEVLECAFAGVSRRADREIGFDEVLNTVV